VIHLGRSWYLVNWPYRKERPAVGYLPLGGVPRWQRSWYYARDTILPVVRRYIPVWVMHFDDSDQKPSTK
jgi:hypothetical protein